MENDSKIIEQLPYAITLQWNEAQAEGNPASWHYVAGMIAMEITRNPCPELMTAHNIAMQSATTTATPKAGVNKETYTDIWGNVIEVASLMWLEDGRYYDVEEGEHRDCARYCTNATEEGADGESVWLNDDFVEVDPDYYPDSDDDEEVDE